MTYTIGSCCSGFAGLEMAVEAVLGPARHLWHAEFNAEKSKILTAHWPTVPNLGDLTTVDWAQVERPDVLTAGFPCTDISAAGRRAGMGAGTRSGIWSHIAEAIHTLGPSLVLVENVRALLSTHAQRTNGTDSDMEPGPAGVGIRPTGSVLRAAGAVLGDLADIGFDAQWTTVAASDIGAPHRRQRVFLIAWPADSEGVGPWHRRAQSFARVPAATVAGGTGADDVTLLPTPTAAEATGAGHAADGGMNLRTAVTLLPTPNAALGRGAETPSAATAQDRMDAGRRFLDDAVALLPTPTARDFKGTGPADMDRNSPNLSAMWALLPTPRATDGTKGGPNQRGSSGDLMLPSAVMELLPTPVTTDAKGARNATAGRTIPGSASNGWTLSDIVHADRWGRYAPAISRWAATVGRPAPEPTEPGSKGQPRLSPLFVEWLMGLPAGWVTDHVGRNPALHALGDGVVWQQGAHALRHLLAAAVASVGVAA